MPKVPVPHRAQTSPRTAAADATTAPSAPIPEIAARPSGSAVSQICVEDIHRLKVRSAELLGLLRSER